MASPGPSRAVVAATFALMLPATIAAAPLSASTQAYRAYADEQADMLVRMTHVLETEIAAGDLEAARNEYAMTHRYLERIRPLVARAGELGRRMDAPADGEAAPEGFHAIERALYAGQKTEGLAAEALRLHVDAVALRTVIAAQAIPLDLLLAGPADQVRGIAARALTGQSEPYSKTDLWDLEAGLDGAQAMVAAIRPQVAARDPLMAARIDTAFARADARLAAVSEGCGYKDVDEVSPADRRALEEATTALVDELSKLRATAAID